MPELLPIRSFNIKVIFLVHFIFISFSLMGHWVAPAYMFYNSILILLLIWSVYHDQSHEPVQLAIVVNGSSIILDVLLLIMCFPSSNFASDRFSAAMAILHLIVRPFSTIILIKNLQERSGSTGVLTGILADGRNESYEDIDRPNIPPSSSNVGGYNFSSAQQI